MWQPSAALTHLRQRAALIRAIREYFHHRGFLEVETPIMAQHGISDVYLQNIKACFRGQTYHLQTSPEYHMKRLLAAGSGPIFQLARVFRDDELGRWHNPEFTLLEWYQLDCNHHDLMTQMDDFLQTILGCPPLVRQTYQQVFQTYCHIDPFNVCVRQLQQTLVEFGLTGILEAQETDLDQYLFLLMTHVIEPAIKAFDYPLAIYHFPPSQAALAQVKAGVAERFEIYFRGIELANGFHELTDYSIQANRFANDLTERQAQGLEAVAIDHYLLAALAHGLPACSGVALGIDRLIALALKQPNIASILAFDISRA